jgi:hypothetical protein
VAVASHRIEAVRTLLEAGASPTVYNRTHLTHILAAATTGFYLYAHTLPYVLCIYLYRAYCMF